MGYLGVGLAGFAAGYWTFRGPPSASLEAVPSYHTERAEWETAPAVFSPVPEDEADPMSAAVANEPPAVEPPPEFPHGITEADIRLAIEMNDRAERGEYILSLERPTDRKAVQSAITDLASRMSANNSLDLRRVFGELGLPPEHAEQLEVHQSKIQAASLEAEAAIEQVLTARVEYDKRVRSMMDDSAYLEYRRFENAKPAVHEHSLLHEYVRLQGDFLEPGFEEAVLELMERTQAYTDRYWHGPYDSLPPVAIGNDMVTASLERDIERIARAAAQLQEEAAAAGLPPEHRMLLERYYAQRVTAKEQTLNAVRNPRPRRMELPFAE